MGRQNIDFYKCNPIKNIKIDKFFIPNCLIHDRSISSGAKMLFGDFTAESGVEGYFYLDILILKQRLKTHEKTILKWVEELEKGGYIQETKKPSSEQLCLILKNKKMQGHGIGVRVCDWCDINTFILHNHHYPIPRAKGGKKTVRICPNCHNEFHYYPRIFKLQIPQQEWKKIYNEYKRQRQAYGK